MNINKEKKKMEVKEQKIDEKQKPKVKEEKSEMKKQKRCWRLKIYKKMRAPEYFQYSCELLGNDEKNTTRSNMALC
jgi:hypothetical protein